MKISTITILLLLALVAVVAGLWVVGPPGEGAYAAGTSHPTIDHMAIGGPGEAKHEKVFALGIAFGILEIILFSVCLALGASRMEKVGRIGVPIAIGAALHVVTFLAIVVSYRSYLAGSETLYLGLPAPTAFMMYGIWWVPMYFIFLYLFAFDRYVFNDADLKKFNEILDRRDRREGIDS
jgi:hypothetical protein